MTEKTVIILFMTLNIIMWMEVFSYIKRSNENNLKISKMQQDYYSKTFQNNMRINKDMATVMNTFVTELRNSFLERENDEVQSETNND